MGIVNRLKKVLKWMEEAEVTIEGEWGSARDLKELERDGDLSDETLDMREIIEELES